MHIAFVLPDLKGGGAQKMIINLANEFAGQGYRVDLILFQNEGIYQHRISDKVIVIEFDKERSLHAIDPLKRYMVMHKPDIILSALFHVNLVTLAAARLAKVSKTKIIVSERNHLSSRLSEMGFVRRMMIIALVKFFYPYASKVIGISDGVCEDLRRIIPNNEQDFIQTIYNPVVTEDFERMLSHDLPSIFPRNAALRLITSGRLVKQKDFPTLLKAVAYYKEKFGAVQLVILGEGVLKAELEKLVSDLGLQGNVSFTGFVDNPLACMKQADIFVLSSAWEGFCNVIVEALYCGLPVVSTDCPSGPAEILKNGKYGELVRVGAAQELAEAIHYTEQNMPDPEAQTGRAMDFTVIKTAKKFKKVFQEVLNNGA